MSDREGVLGGSVNRPGSIPEIQKLPFARCVRCGLKATVGIVHLTRWDDWRCKNERMCDRRVRWQLKQATR